MWYDEEAPARRRAKWGLTEEEEKAIEDCWDAPGDESMEQVWG